MRERGEQKKKRRRLELRLSGLGPASKYLESEMHWLAIGCSLNVLPSILFSTLIVFFLILLSHSVVVFDYFCLSPIIAILILVHSVFSSFLFV